MVVSQPTAIRPNRQSADFRLALISHRHSLARHATPTLPEYLCHLPPREGVQVVNIHRRLLETIRRQNSISVIGISSSNIDCGLVKSLGRLLSCFRKSCALELCVEYLQHALFVLTKSAFLRTDTRYPPIDAIATVIAVFDVETRKTKLLLDR